MAANSRFSIAIHLMTTLAYKGADGATSEYIASSVNTNPVVIRRLLSQLRKAGLVACQPGKSGGCRLARRPERISLHDIFIAIEAGGPFAIPAKPENKACLVSCQMKGILKNVFEQTEQAIAASLKGVSLEALVKNLEKSSAA